MHKSERIKLRIIAEELRESDPEAAKQLSMELDKGVSRFAFEAFKADVGLLEPSNN